MHQKAREKFYKDIFVKNKISDNLVAIADLQLMIKKELQNIWGMIFRDQNSTVDTI